MENFMYIIAMPVILIYDFFDYLKEINLLGVWQTAAFLILLAAERALPIIVMFKDQKGKKNSGLWEILPVIFGLPGLLVYMLITRKNKTEYYSKKLICSLLSVSVLITVSFGIFIGAYLNPSLERVYDGFGNEVTYADEDGERVRYDKKGNSYTYEEYMNGDFLYFDKNGKSYKLVGTYYGYDDSYFLCTETNEKYSLYYCDDEAYIGAIDKNGNFVLIQNDETENIQVTEYRSSVIADKDGNLYFDIVECYWSPDGKFFATKLMQKSYDAAQKIISGGADE